MEWTDDCGLARAGLALDEPRYRDAAVGAAAFLKRSLTEENGRLLARWRAGQAAHPGKLDDYAFCAWGLLELYGVTFRTAYLAEARDLTARLLEQFFDGKNGGFYHYAADGEQLITRTKETYDGASVVGQCGPVALVLSRLARLTGEARWLDTAGSAAGLIWLGLLGPIPPDTVLLCWCFWRSCGPRRSWSARPRPCRRSWRLFCGRPPGPN